jgi:hypothetical protein
MVSVMFRCFENTHFGIDDHVAIHPFDYHVADGKEKEESMEPPFFEHRTFIVFRNRRRIATMEFGLPFQSLTEFMYLIFCIFRIPVVGFCSCQNCRPPRRSHCHGWRPSIRPNCSSIGYCRGNGKRGRGSNSGSYCLPKGAGGTQPSQVFQRRMG